MYIHQQLICCELDAGIGKAGGQLIVKHRQGAVAIAFHGHIPAVSETVIEGLPGEDAHDAVHSLRLVGLYGVFESHYSTFLCVCGL